jgi:hypothetical protein
LFYVFGNKNLKIDSELNVNGSLGIASFKVVVQKENVKEVKALNIVKPSQQVANAKPFNDTLFGAIGLVVQDIDSNEKYILTCYHAVWNSGLKMKWSGFANESDCKISSPLNGSVIGNLYIGIKNYKLDIALIKPIQGIDLSNEMPGNKKPKAVRTLTDNDVTGGTRLCVSSRQNPGNYNFGTCANVNCTASITYPDDQKRSLEKLYQIETIQKSPFSVAGDSGSLIVDEFDYAVGLLVAGDEETTSFAIPLESILSSYNLKLFI